MTEPFEIREAQADDAAAIAGLHIESWRDVYRDILPKRYLEDEISREREQHWSKALSSPVPGNFVLLLERDGVLLGFVSVVRHADPNNDAEIENIHIRPGLRSGGMGRRLLGAAIQRLRNEGASSLFLWVFDDNTRAFKFYNMIGGQTDETGFDEFADGHMPHTRFSWCDLAELSDACQS